MNETHIARRFLISGEVQGVGFRYFSQRAAARHQVVGYAKNLSDGRVETYAEGTENAVRLFAADMATGPTFAKVTQVEEIVCEPSAAYSSFLIER